jgi:glycosyltransferase involved in cell wall biosynthesis
MEMRNRPYYGGAEVKQVIIGAELAKLGYNVTFVTYKEKTEEEEMHDGIRIIPTVLSSNTVTRITKIKKIWKCLIKANSDIYVHSSGSPGILPVFCLLKRKKFVLLISNDRNILFPNLNKSIPLLKYTALVIALSLDIYFADYIVVQSDYQKEIIEKKFRKKCVVIKNPIALYQIPIEKAPDKRTNIIWVAGLRRTKQPDIFLKLAERLPQYKFILIGARDAGETDVYEHILSGIQRIPNINYIGFIPHDEMAEVYGNARILVNTSSVEGFPNTFLEAWQHQVPVVSLNVDPDEIICTKNLGYHSRTFEKMVLDIENIMKDDVLFLEFGKNGKSYIESNHSVDEIINKYVELIKNIS